MRSKMARWLLSASLLALVTSPVLAAGRGYLGVTTQSTDEDLRRGLDLSRDGLLVNSVSDGSPADRAGLQKGDVILTYNSRSVTEPEELRRVVRATEPGRTVSLGIWRDGSRRTLQVEVGDLPGSLGSRDSRRSSDEENGDDEDQFETPVPPEPPTPPAAPRAPRAPRALRDHSEHRMFINGQEVPEDELEDKLKDMKIKMKGLDGLGDMKFFNDDKSPFMAPMAMGRGRLGVRVEKLNGDMAQALGARGEKGVLVTEVLEDTPAQRAGIRAGDVIQSVDGEDVNDPDELVKVLAQRDGKVEIDLVRRGDNRTVEAELEDRAAARQWRRDTLGRRNGVEIPEPGATPRVYRWKTRGDSDSEADLRREIEDLKRELQELRDQLREKR
jgi:C-terminal processing protease CtpA/Prc